MVHEHPRERRIFIQKYEKNYQIFDFSQKKDGSIYCHVPEFEKVKWLALSKTMQGLILLSIPSAEPGKLSIHASGQTHLTAYDNPTNHSLVINGNYLADINTKRLGVRHLLTAFIQEPQVFPNSPVFSRRSDVVITTKELKPFVVAFFAIPQHPLGMKIDFEFNLDIEEMENIQNDFLEFPGFSLRYHDIFGLCYRTKYMDYWPKRTHIYYHDGFFVPVFIGTGEGKMRVELREPEYRLLENLLTINCSKKDIKQPTKEVKD